MYSNLMHKYFKNRSEFSIQPTTEGWGNALQTVASIVLPIAGLATGSIVPAMISIGLTTASAVINHNSLKKLINQPKLQKYIIGECDKIYAKAKKEEKTISPVVGKLDHMMMGSRPGNSDTKFIHKSTSIEHKYLVYNVGKYTVGVYGDTDHIDGMVLLLQVQNDKLEWTKIRHFNIPAPTREDLKKMGFYEKHK